MQMPCPDAFRYHRNNSPGRSCNPLRIESYGKRGTANRVTSGAHIGAGVLSAYVLGTCLHQPITPVVVGMAVGLSLLPDLDALWVRARQHWRGTIGHNNHHTLLTHTPQFYLSAAALLSCWAAWQSVVFFLVVTLGHLMLDSWATDDGIMWLYPFRRKQYALLPRPIHAGGLHGKEFYKRYYRLWHFFVAESAFMMGGLLVTWVTFMPEVFHLA